MNTKLFVFIARRIEGIGQPKTDSNSTIYGITERWYPLYYKTLKEAIAEGKDKELIDAIIVNAYKDIFYNKTKSHKLPIPLCAHYFDMSFNMGEDDAIKVLQTALKKVVDNNIIIDGDWGSQTQEALDDAGNYEYLARRYAIERREYYIKHTSRDITCGLIHRCNLLEEFLEENAWYA